MAFFLGMSRQRRENSRPAGSESQTQAVAMILPGPDLVCIIFFPHRDDSRDSARKRVGKGEGFRNMKGSAGNHPRSTMRPLA